MLPDEIGDCPIAEQAECSVYRFDSRFSALPKAAIDLLKQGYTHAWIECDDIGQIVYGLVLVFEYFQRPAMIDFEGGNRVLMRRQPGSSCLFAHYGLVGNAQGFHLLAVDVLDQYFPVGLVQMLKIE